MDEIDLKDAALALEKKGEIAVLTAGCSMKPMLREHRDVVVIKKVDRPLKSGDVVLYSRKDEKFILHRIIRVRKDGYLIRGDNNFFNETDITDENIVGILKCFYRDGKYFDCKTSVKYKMYVRCRVLCYPLRKFFRAGKALLISKIKHKN